MNDKLEKLILFLGRGSCCYPILDTASIKCHAVIIEAQHKLTCAQWNDYANELEAIMLSELDEHLPSTKCSSLELGRCILMLRASDEQKIDALINALELT